MRPNAVRKESDFHACVIGLSTENVTRIKAIEAGQLLGRNPVKANDLSGPAGACVKSSDALWNKINPGDIIAEGLLYFSSSGNLIPLRCYFKRKLAKAALFLLLSLFLLLPPRKWAPAKWRFQFLQSVNAKESETFT